MIVEQCGFTLRGDMLKLHRPEIGINSVGAVATARMLVHEAKLASKASFFPGNGGTEYFAFGNRGGASWSIVTIDMTAGGPQRGRPASRCNSS